MTFLIFNVIYEVANKVCCRCSHIRLTCINVYLGISGYNTGAAKHSPDGASGLSPNTHLGLYEPSPVLGSESNTRNGPVHSEFPSTHSPTRVRAGQAHTPTKGSPSTLNLSHSRKLSLDPHVRLKVEKLEMVGIYV